MGPTIIKVMGEDSTARCVIEFDVKPMTEFCDGLKFWCFTSEFVRPREPGKKIYFERISTSSESYTEERDFKMLEQDIQINAIRLEVEEHEQRISKLARQIKNFARLATLPVTECYDKIRDLVDRVRHANSMTRFNEIYMLIALLAFMLLFFIPQLILLEKYKTKWLLEQAGSGNELLVKLLLSFPGIGVNGFWINSGATALFVAAMRGHLGVVEALLSDNRTDVNSRANYTEMANGVSPLFVAAERGQEEVVKLMLSHPAVHVNAASMTSGYTPLMASAMSGTK